MPAARSLPRTKPKPDVGPTPHVPDALGLSTAHISPSGDDLPDSIRQNPYLTAAKNGNLTVVKPSSRHKSRGQGGGLRGNIMDFTHAARRRMQQLLNSIDRTVAVVPVLITLTYHNEWSEDPAAWKDQLDAFRKRLERKYGRFSAIWRLEYQRRGAPHFHLMCFFWDHAGKPGLLPFLRMDVGGMWWEVTGRTSQEHLVAGTRCELPRSWKGANVYLSKYMTKSETLSPGQASPGRFWGVWRSKLLPIVYEAVQLTFEQAFRARRLLRRYSRIAARRWDVTRFSCFISYSTTCRLMEWLGYYPNSPPDVGRGGGGPAAVAVGHRPLARRKLAGPVNPLPSRMSGRG